jgi:hypothetical protein
MIAFFRSHVGATDAWFANLFNPESIWVFEPRVDRGYSPGLSTAQSKMLEDFLNPTGTSSYGLPNEQPNITLAHTDLPEHFDMKGADLAWSAPGGYFQTNFATAQLPFNLTSYQLLDVRVDRAFDPLNGAAPTDFQIQLVKSNGALSAPVSISAYNQQIDGAGGRRHQQRPAQHVADRPHPARALRDDPVRDHGRPLHLLGDAVRPHLPGPHPRHKVDARALAPINGFSMKPK